VLAQMGLSLCAADGSSDPCGSVRHSSIGLALPTQISKKVRDVKSGIADGETLGNACHGERNIVGAGRFLALASVLSACGSNGSDVNPILPGVTVPPSSVLFHK
jgi:hypothetical protein